MAVAVCLGGGSGKVHAIRGEADQRQTAGLVNGPGKKKTDSFKGGKRPFSTHVYIAPLLGN